MNTSEISKESQQKAGKYLTFCIGAETYGIEILKVREIIGLMPITAVPRAPTFVKGVINLRGKVIPVLSLRLKFGLEEIASTEETCVIVVNVGSVEMGIIVDKVREVLDIAAADIEEPPNFGVNQNLQYILGMGKAAGKVSILLAIEKVLSGSEIVSMADTVNS